MRHGESVRRAGADAFDQRPASRPAAHRPARRVGRTDRPFPADGRRRARRKVENATENWSASPRQRLSRVIPPNWPTSACPPARGVRRALRRRGTDALRQPGGADHRPGRDHRVRGHSHSMYEAGRRSHREAWAKACAGASRPGSPRGAGLRRHLFSAADSSGLPLPADETPTSRKCWTSRRPSRRRHKLPEARCRRPANCWRRSSTTPPACAATS